MIEWSEQHLTIRDMVRRFVAAEIRPRLMELEHGDLPPYDILRKMMAAFGLDEMARLRFQKQIEREKAEARGEKLKEPRDARSAEDIGMRLIPIIELCRYCPGMVTALGVSVGLAAQSILSKGTIRQKERWALDLLTLDRRLGERDDRRQFVVKRLRQDPDSFPQMGRLAGQFGVVEDFGDNLQRQMGHLVNDVQGLSRLPAGEHALGAVHDCFGITPHPPRVEGRLQQPALAQPLVSLRNHQSFSIDLAEGVQRLRIFVEMLPFRDEDFANQIGMVDEIPTHRPQAETGNIAERAADFVEEPERVLRHAQSQRQAEEMSARAGRTAKRH